MATFNSDQEFRNHLEEGGKILSQATLPKSVDDSLTKLRNAYSLAHNKSLNKADAVAYVLSILQDNIKDEAKRLTELALAD